MANTVSRIKEFMDFKGIKVATFERSIGMSNASFGKTLKNGGSIGTDKLENILRIYPELNINWLLTGNGNMLCEVEDSPHIAISRDEGTPYYDVDFLGGFSEIINNQTTLPSCNIIVPGFEKATVWCNVTGHSMEPRINHGDIIALRECTIDDIQFGEIYAVVLDTIRTIKILRRGSSPATLLYVPINKPDYEEQEFNVSRIIKIFEVVGSVSKFF